MSKVLVAQAEFLRPEDQRDLARAHLIADFSRAILETAECMLQKAMAARGGADNQSAVLHGVRKAVELLACFEHSRGVDCGFRFSISNVVGVHDTQSRKPEVAHRTRRRPDIERIAWRYEYNAQRVG